MKTAVLKLVRNVCSELMKNFTAIFFYFHQHFKHKELQANLKPLNTWLNNEIFFCLCAMGQKPQQVPVLLYEWIIEGPTKNY